MWKNHAAWFFIIDNTKLFQITSNRLHCKIAKKTVSLSYDKSLNKSDITVTLKRHMKNSFQVKHLTPGYKYGVQLIFQTTQGNLISSPIYSVSPLIG